MNGPRPGIAITYWDRFRQPKPPMPPKAPTLALLRAWLEHPLSTGPTVSADGRSVQFISNRGGLPQAWSVPIEGGVPVRLHSARENVGRLLASPTGPRLLLTIDHGGDEQWQVYLREGDPTDSTRSVRPLTENPARIHELGAWRDGERFVFSSNERDERFFDVYEMACDRPAAPKLVHQEDALVSVLAAEGERALLARANSNLDSDLILADEGRETLLSPHSGELTVWAADLQRDGVIAAANPEREFAGLVRFRPGGSSEVLKEFGADVETLKCEPGRSRVAFAVNREGWSELHVYDTRSNEDRVLEAPGMGVIGSFSWVPNSDGFVFEHSSPSGHEVWRFDLATDSLRPVTRSPTPLPGPAIEPSLHRFSAEDGLEVPYWEYAPTSGAVRGTIVNVHGGPEGQARPYFFSGLSSFLVSEGWRVIEPNVRGSTGYGRTYVHLDDVRKRMDSVRDLRDLFRALFSEGKAVPGRVGIIGGSYGGFMVLAAITTYPELWSAAVEFFGISNFVTFLERTGPWRRKVREAEYGSLERDREFLATISPIYHVDRIVAPLLVAQGDNDVRVPLEEAEQIVSALKRRGVPVDFLRYANEGHGFSRLENQVDSYGRATEFFDRYLPPP